MNSSVYALLDRQARSWWHYRQLREEGNHKEARAKERWAIRQHVRTLREAIAAQGICFYRDGRFNLEYGASSLSGFGEIDRGIPACCVRLGIIVCDNSGIPEKQMVRSILSADGRDRLPGLKAAGAIVYNETSY